MLNFKGFCAKGMKSKLGGKGEGGIYKKISDGKKYLIKRVNTNKYKSNEKEKENFRTHDEILAGKLLKAAGVKVPNMSVENSDGKHDYVASEMLLNVKNLKADEFNKLPIVIRERVYSSIVINAWLCNRDIINVDGDNYVIDSDKQIFQVDFGCCLLSGFRSQEYQDFKGVRDKTNFEGNPINLIPFQSEEFGTMYNQKGSKYNIQNKNQIENFFIHIQNEEEFRSSYLQGVLRIQSISDSKIEEYIDESGHEKEDKDFIKEHLQKRKNKLINYATEKYGERALEEEELSLELRSIMYMAGVFNDKPSYIINDASVSWYSQEENAYKPNVKINAEDNTVKIEDISGKKKAFEKSLEKIGLNKEVYKLSEFKRIIKKNRVAEKLKILLGSYDINDSNNKSPLMPHHLTKGTCKKGFRPQVDFIQEVGKSYYEIETNNIPNKEKFIELLKEKYDLSEANNSFILQDGKIKIESKKLEVALNENPGARKTAVISENKDGNIMAGQLSKSKKGVDGFATAGGGSDYPMNPKKAAASEGGDEFGYEITENKLRPIGSTVSSGAPNIYVAPPGATSNEKKEVDYQEFIPGTVKYYSFVDFRKQNIKFDRSSIVYYVKDYETKIQQKLFELGFLDCIVICSKKSKKSSTENSTIGQISIKPSIENSENKEGVICLSNSLKNFLKEQGIDYDIEIKDSYQDKNNIHFIKREICRISANPATVFNILAKQEKAAASAKAKADSDTEVDAAEQAEGLSLALKIVIAIVITASIALAIHFAPVWMPKIGLFAAGKSVPAAAQPAAAAVAQEAASKVLNAKLFKHYFVC